MQSETFATGEEDHCGLVAKTITHSPVDCEEVCVARQERNRESAPRLRRRGGGESPPTWR